jgi:hypothetical protein
MGASKAPVLDHLTTPRLVLGMCPPQAEGAGTRVSFPRYAPGNRGHKLPDPPQQGNALAPRLDSILT